MFETKMNNNSETTGTCSVPVQKATGLEGAGSVRIYSCVALLSAEAPATLPATQGHHAHAAFLDLVRGVDPDLAAWLHDSRGRKPFTVSPLRGLPAGREGQVHVPAGWTCWLRFTFLAQPVFDTFLAALLKGETPPRIRLGTGSFLVTEVLCTPGSHPWAGWTTAEALGAITLGAGRPGQPGLSGTVEVQNVATAGAAETSKKAGGLTAFTFELASPTAWSLGGNGSRRVEVLPTPALFFGSLLSSWNAWFGDRFGHISPEVRDYFSEAVVVSRLDLKTRMYRYHDHLQVGVVGRVSYRLLDVPGTAEARVLNTLADLAFYTGVGYQTTMGMGQVRRLPDESLPL